MRTDSNRLMNISGTTAKTYGYDNAGNIKSDGVNLFSYDGRGRLISRETTKDTVQYGINGLGERVSKLKGETGNYYIYDEAGHLHGEYDLQGAAIQEYVWLEDQPVAVLSGNSTYYIYADHLNTPRAVADNTNKVICDGTGEPFGNITGPGRPDGDGIKFIFNLRFPGQYFDSETGFITITFGITVRRLEGIFSLIDWIGWRGEYLCYAGSKSQRAGLIRGGGLLLMPLSIWVT